jgi:hypothetical protein
MLRALSSVGRLLGLGRAPAAEPEEERRLWGRIPCDVEVTCRATAGHTEPHAARARNISRGGINLTVGRAFQPGELISVVLPGSDHGETEEVLACVVRCEELEDGLFELGCTFAAQLQEDDLQRFGARRERTVPPDQRVWVRFPCHARAAFQLVRGVEGATSWEASVLNISASGIAMQVPVALNIGDLLSVELRRDDQPVLVTLASVVRVSADPAHERLVGCNFIRALSEDTIKALV